ncbi:hypothetical protein FRC05_002320 [Tulasnella sp. 425]|nr:hypothetical protein FRC05_002320 [Tulasnella sp. 425]
MTGAFPPALERELQDSDWSRFLFHSKTTKTIYYDIGSLRNVIPLEILSHSLLSTSFPTLERLSVLGQTVEEGPVNIIPLLLRPSLRYVKFHTQISDFKSPFVGPLGTIAESSSLSLEEMALTSLWDLGPFRDFGTKAIEFQTGLRRLTLLSMSDITSMVEGAKHLPFLEELDVGTSQVYSRLPGQDFVSGFRSLTTLAVTGAPADIHNLLRSTQSDSLARVALAPNDIRAVGIYPELIAEMQRFRSHLLHLQLTLNVPSTWEDLEPALALVRLQTFGLTQRGSNPHTITDAQVRRMVDSWPHLTRFRLKSESTEGLQITLSSLAYIAFKCPNLRKLAVTFEGRQGLNQEFSNRVDALPESSEKSLELLDVTKSMFDEGDEERLADEIFRLWWPKARFCQSSLLALEGKHRFFEGFITADESPRLLAPVPDPPTVETGLALSARVSPPPIAQPFSVLLSNSPIMHRFWEITELVLSVIHLLSKGDQARLARVNHRLGKIAITEIWSDVPDVRYFFFLFPPDLCLWSRHVESYPAALRRPIRTSDWDRLVLCSQNTKTLQHTIQKGVDEVPDVIWSHDKLLIAFPNLQSLNVSVLRNVPPGLADTISPLLRPTLRKLCLSAEISRTGFPFHSALRRIAQDQTLSLDEMSLSCIWGINHLLNAGSAAVRSQRNLRRLRLYSAEDIAVLSDAARYLPYLTELDVGNLGSVLQPSNIGILDWSADRSETYFRTLVTLRASGSPIGIHKFLRGVSSKALADVAVRIDIPLPAMMKPDVCLALQAFRATLTTLEMIISGAFAWEDLEPILDLRGLRKFALTYSNSAVIPQVGDAQVLQITTAWPHLTSLSLNTRSCRANITLRGLGYIASNCPNLRTLIVGFNGTQQGNPSYLAPCDKDAVRQEMELVDILWSHYDPNDELRITASFLRRWWPRAHILGSRMDEEKARRWEEANRASRMA